MNSESGLLPINPESLGKPRGYSNGMLAEPGGQILFISGQIAWDEHQNIVCDDFRGQFAQALTNVIEVARAAGGGPGNIGQLTIYVTDKREYTACLGELGETFRLVMDRHFPAMALVEVKSLLEPRAKVEIQGLAVVYPREDGLSEATGTFNISDFPSAVSKDVV
jgi:enamine deaminase RidA (YjgF/YER057c/UK114 family)